MDLMEIAPKILFRFIPFLFALCFHEYAHGLVAKWRGDNTAEQLGRLTMNPMAHADLIGTFILPLGGMLFGLPFVGWAKPVPVNSRNLKNIRSDMFWIALAGPASNLLLAVLSTVFLYFAIHFDFLGDYAKAGISLAVVFISINLMLAVFNILPIHPLDGGKVLARFLPVSINYKLEQHAQMTGAIVMMLAFAGGLRFIFIPVEFMLNHLLNFAGMSPYL